MKLHATSTSWLKLALWLLPFLIAACSHKAPRQQARTLPPAVHAGPKPAVEPVELPLSAMMIPSEPLTLMPVAPREQRPRPPIRQRPPASGAAEQAAAGAATSTQQAASESPAVSAIGELSSGDSVDLRNETVDSIAAIERNLNAIDRKLGSQEQKTAAQIKEYLKQAKAALASGDVDGAHTLAAKAKVLLNELSH